MITSDSYTAKPKPPSNETLPHKLACAVAAGHLLISQCNANQPETISGLLRPLIGAEAAKQGGSWEWEIVGQGGYLMRMLMDATGDDRAELFLTTSLTSFKHHAEWRVFTIETNDEFRPYDRTLHFAADSVWPARAGGKTILLNSLPPGKEDQRALPREMHSRWSCFPCCSAVHKPPRAARPPRVMRSTTIHEATSIPSWNENRTGIFP